MSQHYFDLSAADDARAHLAKFAQADDATLGDTLLADMQSLLMAERTVQAQDAQRLTQFAQAMEAALLRHEARVRHRMSGDVSGEDDIPLRALRYMLAECFRRMLERHHKQAPSEWLRADAMAAYCGAALAAFTHHVRWSVVNGEAVPAAMWRAIHATGRLTGAGGNTSSVGRNLLEATYVRLLLLSTLNTGALLPRQIERTERWFAQWETRRGVRYALENALDPARHYYCFDSADSPDRAHGPVRVEGASAMTSPRYIATDGLLSAIAGERSDLFLETAQTTLGDYGANPLFDFSEALDHLHRFWTYATVRASARGGSRQGAAGDTRADALVGFGALARWAMRGATFGEQCGESWTLSDRSPTGYGLLAALPSEQDIGKGLLVGVHEKDATGWALGHVVRVQALADRKSVSVGVQRLGQEVYAVRFISENPVLADDPADDPNIAFYVGGDPARGLADSLIIGRGRFDPKANFSVLTEKAMYQIRMNRVIQQGDDWERVGFEVFARVLP